jgi:hypothetical protein
VTGDHFARDADKLDREFLEQVEASHLGRIRCLTRGEVLHWQGDPVEYVFVVSSGSLRDSSWASSSSPYEPLTATVVANSAEGLRTGVPRGIMPRSLLSGQQTEQSESGMIVVQRRC